MKLADLAIACRIYEGLTNFDDSYQRLIAETSGNLELRDAQHVSALLDWLRKWGCRQFEIGCDGLVAEFLSSWAAQWEPRLPGASATLEDLSDMQIHEASLAYAALLSCPASYSKTAGPTRAAKILFATRPGAFPPWDGPIRDTLVTDSRRPCQTVSEPRSAFSYCQYLHYVRELISELASDAQGFGIRTRDIPNVVGRPQSSLAKLIDEYKWVTITEGFSMPDADEIGRWYQWATG